MSFPASPSDGMIHSDDIGRKWTYTAASNKWDLTASGVALGSGDMLAATYDPATVIEQLVGLTAAQTLTNKTLTSPTLTTPTLTGVLLDQDPVVALGAATKQYVDDTAIEMAVALGEQ